MKLIFKFVIIVLLVGCSSKNTVPKNILPQDQMQNVMWDLMRVDEFVSSYVMKDSSLNKKEESNKLYEQVFKINSTTKEKFIESMLYYQSRPDLLKTIADSMRKNQHKVLEEQFEKNGIKVDTSIKERKIKSKLVS